MPKAIPAPRFLQTLSLLLVFAATSLTAQAQPISGGRYYTCAVLDGGVLKCWGENSEGQLGLGDTTTRGDTPDELGSNLPSVDVGAGRSVRAVAAGRYHTCAILDDGSVKCWGLNDFGQLGLGDTDNRGDQSGDMGNALPPVALGADRTAKAISAGRVHTCAILDDDSVKCWGQNNFGQLGIGAAAHRGNDPDEMGDALPVVDLGTNRTAKAIATGNFHTCALLDNDHIKCWGRNDFGQLGLGDTDNRGDQSGELGSALPAVDLGSSRTATALAAGYYYTCAALDDGTVKCWGYNRNGQLGVGDTATRGDAPNEMGNNLPVAPLGTGRTAQALVSTFYHTCALLDGNEVKCWGYNNHGQLSLGDTEPRGDAPNEMGDNLPLVNLGSGRTAQTITVGSYHACAVLDDNTIKCWGRNEFGQLGLGDVDNRGDAPNEMGDNLPPANVADAALPVELTSFDAFVDGERVVLHWTTGSETHNAGFEVQQLHPTAAETLGFVAGAGTTLDTQRYRFAVPDLAPGTHRFRLRQLDYDGSASYSPSVEVHLALHDTYRLTAAYPNPFHDRATFTLHVRRKQHVEIGVYDLLGRRVEHLYAGTLRPGMAHLFAFNASTFAAGTYVIQATGEAFTATQRVTVAR